MGDLLKVTKGIGISVLCIILAIVFVVLALFSFALLSDWDKYGVKTTLWFNEREANYTDVGFGDSVEYGEYCFSDEDMEKFSQNRWYEPVTTENAEKIYGYFEDYEGWLPSTDFADKYDFDKERQIKIGDYFYIYTSEGESINNSSSYGQYDNYDVYYVNMEANTVYFIHANI